jgi:putative ABC transport system substrate-binding protein
MAAMEGVAGAPAQRGKGTRSRRLLIVALGLAAAIDAGGASSAPAATPQRVLHVCDCPPAMAQDERSALLLSMARLGYEQGRNLDLVSYDFTSAGLEAARRAPMFSVDPRAGRDAYAEFLARQVVLDRSRLVLASGMRAAQGASRAALDVPVVFWRVSDPIGVGLVDSLARPGANRTGFSRGIEKLTVKRLELLQEMLPRARTVAFLFVADYEHHRQQAAEVRQAAAGRKLRLVEYSLPMNDWSAERLEATFARMRQDGVDALLLPDVNVQPRLVSDLAAKHRLPTIHSLALAVIEWGGLAAYTTSERDELPGVARYAVRILAGERAGDLPVQEPAQYELVLNSRAARALGISFPRSFMLRATSVIDK